MSTVYMLTEGQVAVRIDYRDLPDLDDLMLEVWAQADESLNYRYGDPTEGDDAPTRFATQQEPDWQWVKMSPCCCGEHGWHWDARSAERWQQRHLDAGLVEGEPDLIADRPRYRFIGMAWDS